MRDFVCKKIKNLKPSGIRKLFDIVNENTFKDYTSVKFDN